MFDVDDTEYITIDDMQVAFRKQGFLVSVD